MFSSQLLRGVATGARGSGTSVREVARIRAHPVFGGIGFNSYPCDPGRVAYHLMIMTLAPWPAREEALQHENDPSYLNLGMV